jgi:molybdopterin molybdotransferase
MAEIAGSRLTPIDEALRLLLADMETVASTETVAIKRSLNRVLADAIDAPIHVPGYNNSGMDGYALNSADLQHGHRRLRVSQRIIAGSEGEPLEKGTAARIFTGAPMPPGADAVVMQENCTVDGDTITVQQAVSAGENVRLAGADVLRGSRLFEAGHRLRAPDVGMLAGVGLAWVEVRSPLRVGVLTTGNELVRPGQVLAAGQIYNSNFYTLRALLRGLGHEILDCGIVPDSLEATEEALRAAAENTDCIISSGGVSAGEEDHVRNALERAGELTMWKLAIKPGKPFAFGRIAGKPFFGLPGNPVSAFVNFALIVRPCLERLGGVRVEPPIPWVLPAAFAMPATGVRQEYLRVRVDRAGQGVPAISLTGSQSSGVLSSVSHCDGLAVVPPHTAVNPGDLLRFIPLSEIVGPV